MTKDYCGNVRAVFDQNHNVVERNEPFKGMNIRVTTYTDGTRHSEKVIR